MSKTMSALYAGKCIACKSAFPAGATIVYAKGVGATCASCAGLPADAPVQPAAVKTFWCQGAVANGAHAATGTPARTVNVQRGRFNGGRTARPDHHHAATAPRRATIAAVASTQGEVPGAVVVTTSTL